MNERKTYIVPYEGDEPFIFVSYSHENERDALSLVERLQRDGYRVWLDEGIQPGSDWDECVAKHVIDCSLFLALLTEEYLLSDNCKDELNLARDENKDRVLIYLKDLELPPGMRLRLNRLQNIHRSNYTDVNAFYKKIYNSSGISRCKREHKNTENSNIGNRNIGAKPVVVEHDGKSAAQKQQIALWKKAKAGDSIFFGKYMQDHDGSKDKQEIEWLVLDRTESKLLVVSKYALDCQPYNTTFDAVTWESCSLRKWLNGPFMDMAFSREEATLIANTTVTADKNPIYKTNLGKDKQDQVFLFSIPEVNKYFASSEVRRCAPTDYALNNGIYVNEKYTTGGKATCWWWLRSPGFNDNYAASVDFDGNVDQSGNSKYFGIVGVRPALWINLES